MNTANPDFCTAVDAVVRSTSIDLSQIYKLDETLGRKAAVNHTHSSDEISDLEIRMDRHLSRCSLSMNQIVGLNDAIENALAVNNHIQHVVAETQGTFIPNRVLTVAVPEGDVSLIDLRAVGYDTASGDVYSSVMHLTVKRFNGTVTVVGDPEVSVTADCAVSKWKVAVVPNSAKGGITVLVQSDPSKRVVWKIVANLT